MKIKTIEIKNFRSIKSDTIDCIDLNTFVGPNGSGKSTVLNALNIFFGEINAFSVDDFHNRDTDEPISIKVVFHQLSEAAQEEFRHYVRGGLLVIKAKVFLVAEDKFERTIQGERLVFEPFAPFFEAVSAAEGKRIFDQLRTEYEGIENATNAAGRREALQAFEEAMDDDEKVLRESGAEFFGISKGVHKLQRHVNWVYVPAVKDASSEAEEAKTSHLGRLIQHTIRSGMDYDTELGKIRERALDAYETLLTGQQSHLKSLQTKLSERLQSAVTSDTALALEWKKDNKSVAIQDPVAQVLLTDKGFSGEVDKFGHGLQRAFLLVILQELMAVDSEVSPTLLLGCEEPELYQHPPQARHLAQIMNELSSGDAQVFITTHSPFFIDVEHFDGIKMFRNEGGIAVSTKSSFQSIMEGYNEAFDRPLRNEDQARTKLAIHTQPKFNEVFFADKVVLVEGISDHACLETYLRLSGRKSDFQKSGSAIVVCEGKSSLALMLLIAKDFKIPYHIIFDCDANCADHHKAEHIRDNNTIFKLAGLDEVETFPADNLLSKNLTAWVDTIEGAIDAEFDDIAEACNQAGRDAVGNLKSSKKNPLYVAASMKHAWDNGKTFPVLQSVVDAILINAR